MKQDDVIQALFKMAGCSVNCLFLSDSTGKHELVAIIRHIADFVEKDAPTGDDLQILFNELAAWNKAKIATFPSEASP